MLNDFIRTYKKMILAVLLLLCAILAWFFGCHRFHHSKDDEVKWKRDAKDEQVYDFVSQHTSGNVTFGTCGHLTSDRIQPVVMNISGRDEDFTGTVRITLPGIDGKGVAYQSAVKCPKGGWQKVVLSVPRLGDVSYFCIELLDQYGTEELAQMIIGDSGGRSVDSGESSGKKTVGIGILSDNPEKLNWLDGLETTTSDKTCLTYKVVSLSDKNLQDGENLLSSLSGILIDDFDSKGLGFREKRCLQKWMEETGGVLIVGTGGHAGRVLSGIGDLAGAGAGESGSEPLQFYDQDESAGYLSVVTSRIRFADKNSWDTEGLSFPVSCYRKILGKGKLVLLTWSLTDGSFSQWTGREKMARELFENVIGSICHPDYEEEDRAWYLKTTLYSWLASRAPGTFYYALFFIIYLLVLFFCAYLFLKRAKKREYIWVVVPVLALIFTVSLAIRSGGFGSNGVNSYSVIEVVDSADSLSDVFFLYQNNEGERKYADLVSDITCVQPMNYDYMSEGNDVASLTRLRQDYTINNARNGFEIVFEEAVPGRSRLLQMKKKCSPQQASGYFKTDFVFDFSTFHGKITNSSAWDFSRIVLIRGNQYALLKNMKAGEEREILPSDIACWSRYDQDNTRLASEGGRDFEGLFEYICNRYITGKEDYNSIIIAGITRDREISLLQGEENISKRQSVLVSRVTRQTPPDVHYISDINTCCLGNEHTGSALFRDTLEEKKTKASYQFDRDKTVSYAVRNRDKFKGSIYAYNYVTGKEDLLFEHQDDVIESEKLEPYLSEMNKMILTYKLEDGKDYGPAPVLTFVLKDVAE